MNRHPRVASRPLRQPTPTNPRQDRAFARKLRPPRSHPRAFRVNRTVQIAVCSPEDLRTRYVGAIDLFVVNSVLQYLSPAEFDQLLADVRALLAPGGSLVVADVIPSHDDLIGDVRNLLATGWAKGFFIAALCGLAATFFSRYRTLRNTVGLARYDEAEFLSGLRLLASPRPAFNRTWASTSGEWHSARRLGEMRCLRSVACKHPEPVPGEGQHPGHERDERLRQYFVQPEFVRHDPHQDSGQHGNATDDKDQTWHRRQ